MTTVTLALRRGMLACGVAAALVTSGVVGTAVAGAEPVAPHQPTVKDDPSPVDVIGTPPPAKVNEPYSYQFTVIPTSSP
jgi:hypothetical protein